MRVFTVRKKIEIPSWKWQGGLVFLLIDLVSTSTCKGTHSTRGSSKAEEVPEALNFTFTKVKGKRL